VASAAATHTGKLALGASQTIGQYLLPNFVAAFLRQNPRVSVTVVSGNTDEMLMAVAERHVQLALIEGPALRKGLHVEPFMEDQMVLVIPAQHRWAEQKIEVESLKQVPILMREVGSGSRRVVENALSKAGLKKKDLISTMEFDSTEGLLSAVEAGLGVTFVSRWAVRNHLALKTLSLAHVNGLKLSRKFSLVYPSGPQLAGNAGAFYQFVLAHAGAGKLKRGGSKILSL
jgi:DNA-binding transcriptional LysR family regulator